MKASQDFRSHFTIKALHSEEAAIPCQSEWAIRKVLTGRCRSGPLIGKPASARVFVVVV